MQDWELETQIPKLTFVRFNAFAQKHVSVSRKEKLFPFYKVNLFISLFEGSYGITHDSDSMLEVKDFSVNDYILNDEIFTLNILLNYVIDPYYCLIERRLFCLYLRYLYLNRELELVIPSF